MLITLWARAVESFREDAITRDSRAVEIHKAIDYDFERFKRGWKSQVGVAVRDRYIDDLVGQFIMRHPHARIINLGAGLDTRFFRIDNGQLSWIDVDLPDAIDLRRRFIHESDRLTFMKCSASDFQWLDKFHVLDRRPTMLIAEGVLMFFEKKNVQRLFDRFACCFPASEMVFDLIGPLMVRFPFLHDTLPETRARFKWGSRSLGEIGDWSDRYDLVSVRSMLQEHPSRWRWMKWCRFLPAMRRQFFVAHCRGCG